MEKAADTRESRRPDGLAAEIGKREPFDSPAQEAFLNLARTFSVLNNLFNQLFKRHGLTQPQYNAMRILQGHGGRVSIYQIAEEMITPQSDMPRLIERLESRAFVTKTRCKKDRRVVWVELTDDGKAILNQIAEPLSDLHRQSLSHLSEEQLDQLNKLLYAARHPNAESH